MCMYVCMCLCVYVCMCVCVCCTMEEKERERVALRDKAEILLFTLGSQQANLAVCHTIIRCVKNLVQIPKSISRIPISAGHKFNLTNHKPFNT